MCSDWLKRLLLIPIAIIFYLVGMYLIDLLVREHFLPNNIEGSAAALFITANCIVILAFLLLLTVVLHLHSEDVPGGYYGWPIGISFVSAGIFMHLPNSDYKILILVPIASVIFMIYLLYEYTHSGFENRIWKLNDCESYWIFNKKGKLELCASDGTVTLFDWHYNYRTRTLVIQNDREKRVYIVNGRGNGTLGLASLGTPHILNFTTDHPFAISRNKYSSAPTKDTSK